jgi:HJR/Mrr/RecB family endonuclease
VGEPKVRELFGVFKANKKLTEAIFVTNGYFTENAIRFADENKVTLINRDKLKGYTEKYLTVIS